MEQGLDDDQAHHPQEDAQQTGAVADRNVVVKGDPDEVRPHPREAGEQDHHHPGEQEPTAVGRHLGQDAAEHPRVEDLAGGFRGAHCRKG